MLHKTFRHTIRFIGSLTPAVLWKAVYFEKDRFWGAFRDEQKRSPIVLVWPAGSSSSTALTFSTRTRRSKTFGDPCLGEVHGAGIFRVWFRWRSPFIMSRATTLLARDRFLTGPAAISLAPRTRSRNSILRACVLCLRTGNGILPAQILRARVPRPTLPCLTLRERAIRRSPAKISRK